MKKIFALLVYVVGHLAVAKEGTPIVIKGQLQDAKQYSKIYFYKILGMDVLPYDSVAIVNGQFQYTLPTNFIRGFYKIGFTSESAYMCVLGKESFTIKGNLEIQKSITFINSEENNLFLQYQKINASQRKFFENLNQQAAKLQQEPGMTEQIFYQRIIPLQKQQDSATKAFDQKVNAMVANAPSYFVSKIIKGFHSDKSSSLTFFTKDDYQDSELVHSDLLPFKIETYYKNFVAKDLNAYETTALQLIDSSKANSENRQVFFTQLIPMFYQYDIPFARALFARFEKEFPNAYGVQKLKPTLPKGPPSVGDLAPDIALKTKEGKVIKLSDLRGQIVLLDFWASWCGPCRMENPNVVKVYNEFQSKGFTVYSVSIDSDMNKWVEAVAKDGLIWANHVSELKGWQTDAIQSYQVKGIPATFLIDQNGYIVATNLRGDALKNKLVELIK
jgi:peroxiredoxin